MSNVKCKTCGAVFESEDGLRPCPNPSPGRPYVDTGIGGHYFDVVEKLLLVPVKDEEPSAVSETKHFAKLTPVEHEMLACAFEESGEIVQIIGKAMRHGIDSHHPSPGSEPNRIEIAREIGQLIAVMQMMCDVGVIRMKDVEAGRLEKFAKIGKYLHHVRIDKKRALIITP